MDDDETLINDFNYYRIVNYLVLGASLIVAGLLIGFSIVLK